jgi:hypothetical protein
MATIRYMLENIPILRIELSSLRALRALNISMITRTLRDKVEAFCLPQVK